MRIGNTNKVADISAYSSVVSNIAIPKVTVIFNPCAGRANRKYLLEMFSWLPGNITLIETQHPGHAREIAFRIPSTTRLFVAGGDGTINEVLNGLVDARIIGRNIPPLGIIPMGTANVLAIEIGMDFRTEAIADYVQNGVEADIFPGMANGRAFMLMAGVGADAQTVADISPRLKRWIGKGAYVWQGLITTLRGNQPAFTITANGQTTHATGVIATHAAHYAGKYILAPDASLRHHNLDIIILSATGRIAKLRYALALLCSRLSQSKDVRVIKTKEIIICSSAPNAALQIDGEAWGRLPCHVCLSDHAIRLIMPLGSATA